MINNIKEFFKYINRFFLCWYNSYACTLLSFCNKKILFLSLLFFNLFFICSLCVVNHANALVSKSVRDLALGENHSCGITTDNNLYCMGRNHYKQVYNGTGNMITTPTLYSFFSSNVSSVSVSDFNTYVLTTSGSLYGWGDNQYGQVGMGSTSTMQTTPQEVLTNVASVSAGGGSVCAVKTNGELYCWGRNNYGQVGNGITGNVSSPTKILTDITSVTVSNGGACAIKTDGKLFCFGQNGKGQVGNGTLVNVRTPQVVLENVLNVKMGSNNTCALKTNGELYCFGNNDYGQIGNNSTQVQKTPTLYKTSIKDYTVGVAFICALTTGGDVYCSGSNESGQVGNGSQDNQLTPAYIISGFSSISSGSSHTCGLNNNNLYCWGHNYYGQIGTGTGEHQFTPIQIMTGISKVITGVRNTCVLKASGEAECWGNNDYGQIGNGTMSIQRSPTQMLTSVSNSSIGEGHACAVKTNGDLFCFGANDYGQIGNGTTTDFPITSVGGSTPILTGVSKVLCGKYHSCALKTNGAVSCWGNNDYGQVGNNSTSHVTSPIEVLTGVSKLFVGNYISCAVKTDNSLWCWGRNDYGQTGDGTLVSVKTPKEIAQNVSSVDFGRFHTCMLSTSNTLYCWGRNNFGQIGNNDSTLATVRNTTTSILTNVTNFSLSREVDTTCAISNSKAYCWGRNSLGQVGNGTHDDQISPYEVISSGASSISTSYHACALMTSGAVKCWGNNAFGEIGNGTYEEEVLVPYQPISSGVVGVTVGESHTCTRMSDNTMYCWGLNSHGELGLGTGYIVPNPSQVPTDKLSNVQSMDVYRYYSSAIDSSGTLKMWGVNLHGVITGIRSNKPLENFDGTGSDPSYCDNCCNHWNYSNLNNACDNGLSNECYASGVFTCYNGKINASIVCNAMAPTCCESDLYSSISNQCDDGIGACKKYGAFYCSGDTIDSDVLCSAIPGNPIPEKCNGIDDDCDTEIDEDFKINNVAVGGECVIPHPSLSSHDVYSKGTVKCQNESQSFCEIYDSDNDGVDDLNDQCPLYIDGVFNELWDDNGEFLYNSSTGTHPEYYSDIPYSYTGDVDGDGYINCIDQCPFDDSDDNNPFDNLSLKDKEKILKKGIKIFGDGCEQIPIGTLPTKTPTPVATITSTETNTPIVTNTNTVTNTATSTATAINTITNTPTDIPTDTPTYTSTSTEVFTNTFTPIATDTNTFTNTITNTQTDIPTDIPTDTPTYTSTNTEVFTNTFTPINTNINTHTPTNTHTYTNTPVSIIEVVTPSTKLVTPQVFENNVRKTLKINLQKFKHASINDDISEHDAKFKYQIHIRKLKRLGKKDNFYKLGKKILSYSSQNILKVKNLDKGIYSIRYRVIISKEGKQKSTSWSRRTLVSI